MQRVITTTRPFADQRPGTSGLRKKTSVFQQPYYLENFVQSVFDVVAIEVGSDLSQRTLVVGGDGRYYNRPAIQTIVRLAAGNGFGRVLVGRGGILSTPALSATVRRRGALGGLVLSASHNPGGPTGDFGIKYNGENGGPSPQQTTELIYESSHAIDRFFTVPAQDVDLDHDHHTAVGATEVIVIDPIEDYAAVLEELFDFAALRALFTHGFGMSFDAMHAVTGPYAHHILEQRLGAPPGTVIHGTPLEDFGGTHPDPNLAHASGLVKRMNALDAPELGAASDGDGDRNMILGRNCFVSPGDSLAIIAEHAVNTIPGYRNGLAGLARSMPTSTAVDRVAAALCVPCYETATGWKFFGNLMDAGRLTICGEESFGTGSDHVREKDGLWAVLCWLSILAATERSVQDVLSHHWGRFGRSFYQRWDYEDLAVEPATVMIETLRQQLSSLLGRRFADTRIAHADDFAYVDPTDGSVTERQGIRLLLADRSRVVYRLSGTGTTGATARIYLERYRTTDTHQDSSAVLAPLGSAATELLGIAARCGRDQPTVIT